MAERKKSLTKVGDDHDDNYGRVHKDDDNKYDNDENIIPGKAIEGLGQHGMVGTSDQSLMNLHDGLKMEFEKIRENYIGAIAKLGELCLASKEPVTNSSGDDDNDDISLLLH